MDLATPVPAPDGSAIRRYERIGNTLIGLAFAAPFLAVLPGWIKATSAFDAAARTLGALLFWALLAWLVTRKRTGLAKARATTVVGVLLCLVAASHVVNSARAARDEALMKDTVRAALALRATHAAQFEALGKRLEALPLAQALSPAGLTSPERLKEGRAVLAQYRTLIDERKVLAKQHGTEFAAFMQRTPAFMRPQAEARFEQTRQANEALLAKLDSQQSAHADAVEAILGWASAQTGRIGMRAGELLLQSEGQRGEFVRLVAGLKQAEESVNSVLAQAAEQEAKAQKGIQDVKALVEK